jgi:phage-related protein
MTINEACKFIYADQNSEEYGLILCNIGSINTQSNDEESELLTSTTPYMDKWHFHGIQKSAPLQFSITVCQASGEFIDADLERQIKKWLCKRDGYHWLQFDQDDLSNIFYRCILRNPQKISVGKYSGGMSFDVICDSQNAWSKLYSKPYSTEDGTLTFKFNHVCDYDDHELCPVMTITCLSSGNISIKNNTTNQTININNCTVGEVVTLDSENNKIKSSISNRILISDWNKKFLTIMDGVNNFNLTGNFTIKLEYRLPIRVGG